MKLAEHYGHALAIVSYGEQGQEPVNFSLECETCFEVLQDEEVIIHKCPRCGDKHPSVLLDNDGEPYLCDECWEEMA